MMHEPGAWLEGAGVVVEVEAVVVMLVLAVVMHLGPDPT